MDFGEVLSRAWKTIWKFKVLWIFGIFAGCGTGRLGLTVSPPSSNFNLSTALPPRFERNLADFLLSLSRPGVLAAIFSVLFILIVIAIFFSILGRTGLILGARAVDAGAAQLHFSDLWRGGLRYFWRLFGLSLLIGSPVLFFYLIFATGGIMALGFYLVGLQSPSPGALAAPMVLMAVMFCGLLCVLTLAAIVLGFLSVQAEMAIVVEDQGVFRAIRRGWQVLTRNIGPIFLTWLILAAIEVAAGLILGLPAVLLAFPLMLALLTAGSSGLSALQLVGGLLFLLYLPVGLVANGILTAYNESVWTLAFLRLTGTKMHDSLPVPLSSNA